MFKLLNMNYKALHHWPTSLSRLTSRNGHLSPGAWSSDTDTPVVPVHILPASLHLQFPLVMLLYLTFCHGCLMTLCRYHKLGSLRPWLLSVPSHTHFGLGVPLHLSGTCSYLTHHCIYRIVTLNISITCLGECLKAKMVVWRPCSTLCLAQNW